MNKPDCIIVHHTGGTNSNPLADTSHHTFAVVNEWHRQQWNFKSSLGHFIGYHYFIDKAGVVTQGRAHSDVGAHTIGKNQSSIGVCLAGNFDVTDPSPAQIEALRALLKKLMSALLVTPNRIYPHRKFSNKTCYGNRLDNQWAAQLVMGEVDEAKLRAELLAQIEFLQQQIADLNKLFAARRGGAV
jgi:N-acetyl-anhydromuramyl-L-alanine amidase AmpD